MFNLTSRFGSLSVRQRVDSKIFRFAVAIGTIVLILAAVLYGAAFYVLNGTIYIRDGSSDVLAQAEDYKRMLAES